MYCNAKHLETAISTLGISTKWANQQKRHHNLLLVLPQEEAPAWHPPATYSQMPKILLKLMYSLSQSYPHLLQASEAPCEDTRGIPLPTFTNEKAFKKKKYCLILFYNFSNLQSRGKTHHFKKKHQQQSLQTEYKQKNVCLGKNKDWKQRLYM